MDNLIPRAAAEQLSETMRDFRVTIVNGPRQAGKTTLLEMFQQGHGGTYRSLDDPLQLGAATADPTSYAEATERRPLIIDEVQRAGDPLILAVKRWVDTTRRPGQFVLAGSTRFLTVPTLSESLAGRAAFVELWPYGMVERTTGGHDFLHADFRSPAKLLGKATSWRRPDYIDLITTGSFPEVVELSGPDARRRWFTGYLRTVIDRDIQEFADIRQATILPQLAALVADRAGHPLVVNDIAVSLGLSRDTVQAYLGHFDTVFLMATVRPWSTNLTSRETKSPKVFFTDAGVAAHLLRVDARSLGQPGNQFLGRLVETFVFTELLKLKGLTSDALDILHYRDRDGREIDFILEAADGSIFAIEVKASASPTPKDARHLTWLRDKLGDRFTAGIVLHLGDQGVSYGDRIMALPISALWGNTVMPG